MASSSSNFCARGFKRFSAKSRAESRIIFCSSVRSKFIAASVFVKPLAGFPAEAPGLDHLAQQRTRTILRIGKTRVENLHHGQAHVKPDVVGERKRPHGVRHAELHDG